MMGTDNCQFFKLIETRGLLSSLIEKLFLMSS